MNLLAIDPGTTESAVIVYPWKLPLLFFDKMKNEHVLDFIYSEKYYYKHMTIEQIQSYGMPVGKSTFKTVFWSGRFVEAASKSTIPNLKIKEITRKEVCLNICNSPRASDTNIITAIVDRFDPDRNFGKHGKGWKSNHGPFYGFFKDIWQAFALALTYQDKEHLK